jgi:DNA-binding HxlR family transcriptional regulator
MVDTNTAVCALEASRSDEHCNDENRKAVVEALARIGDKWTVMVVGALSQGPIRYNEIRRRVEGISQRMLTLTLKGLEQDGLATRTMYPTIPPRVDYELTELGRKLIVPLKALHEWALENRPAMLAAREAFRRGQQDGSPRASFTAPK